MWSLVPRDPHEKGPDFGFFRASDHVSKPRDRDENFFVLRKPSTGEYSFLASYIYYYTNEKEFFY